MSVELICVGMNPILMACSLSQSVKDDLEIMDSNPLVRKDIKILGFIYDITDGTVKQVKVM